MAFTIPSTDWRLGALLNVFLLDIYARDRARPPAHRAAQTVEDTLYVFAAIIAYYRSTVRRCC